MTKAEKPDPDTASLARLKAIVDRLRSPNGCPWDLEQTPESLKPFLLEEAHEVAEAIERGDPSHLREELGDLLMNIFLQARIAEERKVFTLGDIAGGIADKLVRRHPHVFGDGTAATSDEVRSRWEEIKREEKGTAAAAPSALRPLPASLPALSQAERLGTMAAKIGFDWPDREGPLRKIEEEVRELGSAASAGDASGVEREIGDLLLAVTSLARHWGLDSERSLRAALQRFRERFAKVEAGVEGRTQVPLDELEALWQEAKRTEKSARPQEEGNPP